MSPENQARVVKNRAEESGREAIMDVAEGLFAERGIDAVSLRTINGEAGYSVAALHYHFGTRDGLVRALLDRAQPPIIEQRAHMIAALHSRPRPSLDEIVDALLRPLMAGVQHSPEVSVRRLRFLSRLFFDRSPFLAHALEEGLELFLPLLRRALPHLDAQTLSRRWLFAAELAQHALANALELHVASPAKSTIPEEFDRLCRELTDFIAGGLKGSQGAARSPSNRRALGALTSKRPISA